MALFASLSLAGTALASAEDVINDFKDNGVIDHCHPRADYDAARTVSVDPLYGDSQGAIDDALANTALVGTSAQPCPPAASAGGAGGGTLALILIPIALVVLGGAVVVARRTRGGPAEGPGDA